MKCPLCGSDGELVFQFHCFNPGCQNYDSTTVVGNSIPTVVPGDRVKFQYYESHHDMIDAELEVVNRGLPSYSRRAGANPDMMEMIHRSQQEWFTVAPEVIEGGYVFRIEEGSWVWSTVWVKEIKRKGQ